MRGEQVGHDLRGLLAGVLHVGATGRRADVRGNVVMKGYYNDPEATATALRGGYFRSGDAAVVQPDGFVDIRDRIKDVIISGGENISSVEVEGPPPRHPAVQEVGVVGLPDDKWGEAPHAFVVLKPGQNAAPDEMARVRPRTARPFQVPALVQLRRRASKDRDRKDSEVIFSGRRSAISTQ